MKRNWCAATLLALNVTVHAGTAAAQDRVVKHAFPARAQRQKDAVTLVAKKLQEPTALQSPPAEPPATQAQAPDTPTFAEAPLLTNSTDAAGNAAGDLAAAKDQTMTEDALDRSLLGYGRWLDDPTYGHVWVPAAECVGKNFAPFATGGYWTDDGETPRWNSLYPWGDATFHYGSWVWSKERGWAWVPGTDYSPARVVWHAGDKDADYVGWAPMPPTQVSAPSNAPKKPQTLPYRFVSKAHLFEEKLESYLVRDTAIGRALVTSTRAAVRTGVVRTDGRATGTYRCRLVTDHPKTWRCGNE